MRLEEAIIAADDLLEPCSIVAAHSRILDPDDRLAHKYSEWVLVLRLSPYENWTCNTIYINSKCDADLLIRWLNEQWDKSCLGLHVLHNNSPYCDLDYRLYTIPEMLRRNRQILEERA